MIRTQLSGSLNGTHPGPPSCAGSRSVQGARGARSPPFLSGRGPRGVPATDPRRGSGGTRRDASARDRQSLCGVAASRVGVTQGPLAGEDRGGCSTRPPLRPASDAAPAPVSSRPGYFHRRRRCAGRGESPPPGPSPQARPPPPPRQGARQAPRPRPDALHPAAAVTPGPGSGWGHSRLGSRRGSCGWAIALCPGRLGSGGGGPGARTVRPEASGGRETDEGGRPRGGAGGGRAGGREPGGGPGSQGRGRPPRACLLPRLLWSA